jgi:hypothetical protein
MLKNNSSQERLALITFFATPKIAMCLLASLLYSPFEKIKLEKFD